MCYIFVTFLVFLFGFTVQGKYIEGVLKTSENWAFLTRFCFLSENGEFEYEIEFNEDLGDLNLLLYYDTDDQWPSVYKSNKTCEQKESVLNRGQNQIVNLTAYLEVYRDLSGCYFAQEPRTTIKTYTIVVPTLPSVNRTVRTETTMLHTVDTLASSTVEEASSTEYSSSQFYSSKNVEDTSTVSTTNSYSSENFYEHELMKETTEIAFSLESKDDSTKQYSLGTTQEHLIKKRSLPNSSHRRINYIRRGRTITCHNSRRFRSSRERWWFIAVSNCDGTKGIDIKYKILMTNGAPGDYWHEHFSADEFYILPVLMAFAVSYSFLMLGIVVCSIELKSRQLLHTTYKIFVLSVVLQLFGIMFVSSCYLKLAMTGFIAVKVKRLGMMLMGASETSFLLLLLLLAKGFTITRGRLPLPASIKLTIFMCIYSVTYVAIFIYEAKVFDPGEVLYLYESPAGYGLIILRIVAWCMFIYSTIFTLKHYPEKGNFYYPFNIFGTIWFIAGPAFILSANIYIDKWIRESVVFAVLLFISFGGHLTFLILTTPSMANKNFPYHVRTTQIGIMEIGGNAGTSTMEQFGHHIYEPSATIREQTVIIPLTRRTEEIFQGMYNRTVLHKNVTQSDNPSDIEENDKRNVMIENVLNWSLAKNTPAIELPRFERTHNHSSTTSSNSRATVSSGALNILSREPSYKATTQLNNFDDYIKEVPIELFTVSKMVVTTNNLVKKNMSKEDSE
ncbi:transmembrane protein 145 [Leptinotarsa decemlineata]|uniref:transmembrane protein 145 n=1 Tax=Leptinotarsa decemlineata TaxID=7539 RepID=UPI003D308A7D